jgi:hypothetical protein
MKKDIQSELNKMKSLFNHKRGVVISEQERVSSIIRNVLNEAAYLPCVQDGDGLCKIKCEIKQAKKGCPTSKEVQEIQHALAKEGMYKGEGGGMSTKCATDVNACDGIFDWRTKSAVEEYQKKYGLSVDGSVGVETITKLFPDLNCDCKKEETGGNDGGDDNGRQNFTDTDCVKIKSCLPYITEKKNIDAFLDCIGYDNITIGGKACMIPCSDYPLTPVETEACKHARWKCACGEKPDDKPDINSQSCQEYIKSKCIQDLESYYKVTACGEYKL